MVLAALALVTLPAHANNLPANIQGKLIEAQGKVYVSTGASFQPARLQQAVKVGTRIFVGTEAIASVAFPGCTVTLSPGKVHTITATPCEDGNDRASLDEGTEPPPLRSTQNEWDGPASADSELVTSSATPVPANYTYIPGSASRVPGMIMFTGAMSVVTIKTINDTFEEKPVSAP